MILKTEQRAKEHALRSLRGVNKAISTLVVSESGNVFANCDVEDTCQALDKEKSKYFIIKGERKQVKKQKEESDKQ